MRGQVLLATAAVLLLVTLLLVTALPKRTLGPSAYIDDVALMHREIQYLLKSAWEEALRDFAIEDLRYGSATLRDMTEKVKERMHRHFVKKMEIYSALKGVWCKLEKVEVGWRTESSRHITMAYVNETYIEASCTDGIKVMHYAKAVATMRVKRHGIFGLLNAKLILEEGNDRVHITSYGVMLHDQSAALPIPLFGSFDDFGRLWLFNTSGILEIRVAIPPEYCLRGDYAVSILAITPGTGAGTLVISEFKEALCR